MLYSGIDGTGFTVSPDLPLLETQPVRAGMAAPAVTAVTVCRKFLRFIMAWVLFMKSNKKYYICRKEKGI
ncbi:MAG: hypothetical protein A2Y87_03410 [Bacteroidetes bacterium RBG_13_46_8]|nr:MAG: hypothetical protein A2Y87_03410 [Bacteroidetes bacterium RBG_13_46_8]